MNPEREYYDDGQLASERWRIDSQAHRLDGPACQSWDKNGQLRLEYWLIYGGLHRVDGPAVQYWHENGQLWKEAWWIDRKHHRIDGPAYQSWDNNGQLQFEDWHIEGTIVEPISDPLEWALFIAKNFGYVHGLDKFCLDNLEEKTARAIIASSRLL